MIKDYEDPAVAGVNYAAIVYDASATPKALTEYASGANYFSNVNNADCGEITACIVKPVGCGAATYSGKASIASSTVLSIVQNEDAGYTETLCIEC